MEPTAHPLPVDRLTELVICLSGADDGAARVAIADAVERHGDWGDGLLNIADALVMLRRDSDIEPPAWAAVSA